MSEARRNIADGRATLRKADAPNVGVRLGSERDGHRRGFRAGADADGRRPRFHLNWFLSAWCTWYRAIVWTSGPQPPRRGNSGMNHIDKNHRWGLLSFARVRVSGSAATVGYNSREVTNEWDVAVQKFLRIGRVAMQAKASCSERKTHGILQP
jgi:hypothetical protein